MDGAKLHEEKMTGLGSGSVESAMFPIGSVVSLERPGGAGHAHVSTDPTAFAELRAAIVTNMMSTFVRLSDEGRVLRIHNGTRAVVIKVDGDGRKVRIVEGYRAGDVGWVEAQYLRSSANLRRPDQELKYL